MSAGKAVRIDAIPYVGKAASGNYEPVTLFFNMQYLDDGRFVEPSVLDGFSSSSVKRQLLAQQMPNRSFKFVMSSLIRGRGNYVYSGTIKPENLLPTENSLKIKTPNSSMAGGWLKGVYIFWLKIDFDPRENHPDYATGTVLFEFEVK